ncbi:protein TASOR isoform X1 [Phyllopteryx taeniolatus]|uniref:protein TASOR isoform X1 n=1 Tax=Phyllopteryx taeniolatus TaxID=161469 RepID=UPI002AD261DF|nr:protein TASOR isoform X1 [Phyllopteryx taeniolatus]
MEYGVARRVPCPPPRRVSSSEYGGARSVSLQDGECASALLPTLGEALPGGQAGPGAPPPGRRSSLVVHQRHMPMEPGKFHIPRKEKKALLKHISGESREYEGVMSILTAGYVDTASAGCFAYSRPRLVHSEQLEKEFVEKRREMKAEGRTEKELEESYCFLLSEEAKVSWLCEKGLLVGQNWHSALGDPNKGVYLCRYSDLLQVHPFHHGASGEIVVFKVMKGKVKSIYENIKNVLDPTPRFDSHLSKNVSKITSVASFRAFEHTQHYFYEYAFDELRQRPRQVCPYAVVSFHYKGKDSPLPSMPLAPVRLNCWPGETSKERARFTVWSGDLVHGDDILFPFSLRSSSLPFLPHKLPDRLEMGHLMRLDTVAKLLPPELFSYNLYGSSKEVATQGHHCSLLEAVDRSRSTSSISRLLEELEAKRVVLVHALTERGFLFLLSSAQMATPPERGESWRRCLQALFVFPESRDVDKSTSTCASSCGGVGGALVMAGLKHFIPALHHALLKSHANPASELSAGVELQAQEYLAGQKEGKGRAHDMGKYDAKEDETAAVYLVPKRHQLNVDGSLRSYLHSPARYQLSVSHARKMVELHCGHLEPQLVRPPRKAHEGPSSSNTHKMQQLMDLVMTCKRNAENEVRIEAARGGEARTPSRKRRMEQRAAERALKYLKASHEPAEWDKSAVEGGRSAALPGSLASAIQSVGLVGVAVREDGSELAGRLRKLLTCLKQAARVAPQRSHSSGEAAEDGRAESSPFERLAAKLGLPADRDVDLRKQDELEEQAACSVSSLEGFSPIGESYHLDPRVGGGGAGRRAYDEDDDVGDIPWRLIRITGLRSERYARRERDLPQDPRFHHVAMATLRDHAPGASPASSPGASPPLCPPPSPLPSPPASPSRCPSPEPSPAPSPEPCRLAPPPDARRPPSPSGCPSPQSLPPQCQSPPLNEQRNHAERQQQRQQQVPPPASGECAGIAVTADGDAEGRESQRSPVFAGASAAPSILVEEGGEITAVEKMMEVKEEAMEVEKAVEVKEKAMEVVDLTVSSEDDECAVLSVSSPPPRPLQGIDCILHKHLNHFSSDLHLLLQEERIQYSLPEAPPYRPSGTPSSGPPAVMPFSQYVFLYHPCPPVEGYVRSLQDGISGMLLDYDGGRAGDGRESALASTVSAFVSSIRAGMGTDGSESAEAAREIEAWGQIAPGRRFSDPPPDAAPRPASVHADADRQTAAAQSTQSDGVSTSCAPAEPPLSDSDLLSLAPAEALGSVIWQLRPEVLSNLCDIIKDVERSSVVQFYVHSVQPEDPLLRDVKEYLTQQGHTEQDPVSFLKQDVADRKLLVIIKNKDIAEHVHEIPGLVSLKQHQSVGFLGIAMLDDIRTHAYEQLFRCGGCVLSEDLIFNPDLVAPVQLEALLALLEQRNSPESVWKWKVHSKPLKKLKEQAKFRRDAASLLDVIVKYHQQKIIEVLPPHHCDNGVQPSPDLDCLIRHQALNTCFRHTVFLRVHSLDFMRYSKSGIIAAGVDEMLHSFDALLGRRDHGDKQTVAVDAQTAKGVARQLSGDDDAEQRAPRPDASLLAHASDPQVPETSVKQGGAPHGTKDLHMLHVAISQMRAQMHRKEAPDTESGTPPAGATVPPANEKTEADSTDDRREEPEPPSSRGADDSVSSSSTPSPLEGEPSRPPESDQHRPPKRDIDERPRQSPSRAPPAFGRQRQQRWRGANYIHRQYHNRQHSQQHNFTSDPHRNPAWGRGFPGKQAGRGFSGGYGGYWGWQ